VAQPRPVGGDLGNLGGVPVQDGYHDLREVEEASRLGHVAVALAEQTPSDRVRVKLVELYQRSTAFTDVPAMTGLRDRMRSVFESSATR
jgi:hypothetical protein